MFWNKKKNLRGNGNNARERVGFMYKWEGCFSVCMYVYIYIYRERERESGGVKERSRRKRGQKEREENWRN